MQHSQFIEENREQAIPVQSSTIQEMDTSPDILQRPITPTLDNATAQALVQKLRRQTKQRWKMYFVATMATALPMLALSTVLPPHLWDVRIALTFQLLIFLPSLLFYPLTWLQIRNSNLTIARIDDMRLIGPFAEALDAERFLKPKPVVAALRRLLPRLQASDAALLTREQRACLYRAINRRLRRGYHLYDKGLAVDILKALQQIGDKEALPHVQRAAKWSRHKDVRDAANDCLPFLFERAEQFNRSNTLLRPADAHTAASEVLLRAATETNAAPPAQLLRASDEQTQS